MSNLLALQISACYYYLQTWASQPESKEQGRHGQRLNKERAAQIKKFSLIAQMIRLTLEFKQSIEAHFTE